MSYILDALRRADSERERGAVPTLHAKPAPSAVAEGDEEASDRGRSPLWWTVIALALALAAVVGWLLFGRGAQLEPGVAVAGLPAAAAVTPSPVAMPPQPVTPPPAPQVAAPSPPLLVQAPPEAPVVQAKPERKPVKPADAKASAASAVEERVPGYGDLPEHIKRELPQLVIGGAMYSQTPANRMLILNGQVFHEGDKVAGLLTLEQIRLKSAVLAYKGHRYSISY